MREEAAAVGLASWRWRERIWSFRLQRWKGKKVLMRRKGKLRS
jgi:hypothetical protein